MGAGSRPEAMQAALELAGEGALLLDGGQHGAPALVQLAQPLGRLGDLPELRLVEVAGALLAVARHEGDGVPLGEERQRGVYLLGRQPEGLSDPLRVV